MSFQYEDLWLVFPLTILMGNTRANRHLSVKRPSGDLLSVANLLNLIVHVAICIGWQIALYLTIISQPDWSDERDARATDGVRFLGVWGWLFGLSLATRVLMLLPLASPFSLLSSSSSSSLG